MIHRIRQHWTIRVRLTALYGGLFVCAGALLLGVTYLLVAQRLDNQADLGSVLTSIVRRPGSFVADDSATIELTDGRRITRQQAIEMVQDTQRKLRDDALDSLVTEGGVALAGVGVVALGFGWLLAGRALRPLQKITETAQRIGGADGAGRGLHERIALAGPRDEVKQLADTFDVMLSRLDQSFEGQRRFVASASHEMRTPLAINRALIEVAITRPAVSTDARELGEALLGVNARHERLVDGLLTLADSGNEVTEHHPVDLAELTDHVLCGLAGAARQAGVEIRHGELDPAPTLGDPYLLERLAQNLVENAVRHNRPDGGWLRARTWTAGDRVRLEVSNTGPAVPRYEMDVLFQPFRRASGAPAGGERGFGLGLSIVRAVAGAHGGDVHAEPRDGGGLVVTVTLPLAGPRNQLPPA